MDITPKDHLIYTSVRKQGYNFTSRLVEWHQLSWAPQAKHMDSLFLLEELVQQINTAQRTAFIAGDRYTTGEQGAYALIDAQGQPANLLIHQHAISGVVDWEGARAGDSAFDLATLLFYGYGDGQVRGFLWEYALARRPIQVLSVYLAHLILRQVDWSLRHHETSVSDRYITRGKALLAEIESRL